MYKIHVLPATFGDSILIEYGEPNQSQFILIDGGPYYVFDDLFATMKKVAPSLTELELLVITHIDIDHIDGMVKLLNQSRLPFTISEIWFNGRPQLQMATNYPKDALGPLQGDYISLLIKKKEYAHNALNHGEPICVKDYNHLPVFTLPGGMVITLLSPGSKELVDLIPKWDKELKNKNVEKTWEKESRYFDNCDEEDNQGNVSDHMGDISDKSKANCSSIAFIATYNDKSCLFAADAPSHILLKAIDVMLSQSGETKLSLDAWKLAHHGSQKSTQPDLMAKIDCKKILISSDGKRYKHPHKPVIENLININGPGLQFFFNYKTEFNEMWDENNRKMEFQYEAIYPDDISRPGITVILKP